MASGIRRLSHSPHASGGGAVRGGPLHGEDHGPADPCLLKRRRQDGLQKRGEHSETFTSSDYSVCQMGTVDGPDVPIREGRIFAKRFRMRTRKFTFCYVAQN